MNNQRQNVLTEGSIVSGLLGLSGPMLASAVLQNLQQLIDMFWVGMLGDDAVAAVAVAGTILTLLFPVLMGAAMGTVAMVSRAIGAGKHEEAAAVAGNSLALSVILGVAMGLAGWAASGTLCGFLGAGSEVTALGTTYLQVSFLGCFTLFVLFVANSALQGAGNAVIPMSVMILANVLNLTLDPIFIFGLFGAPRMEVMGAALATVLSQLAAALVVVCLLSRGSGGLRVRYRDWLLDRGITARLLRVGIPSTGQMLSRSLMALALMKIVSGCGTAAQAAYGIAMRFHMLLLMPAFSLGNATATMVGQNLGAGKPDRAARIAWTAAGIDMALMAIAAVPMMIFAPELMRRFSQTSGDVIVIGTDYIRTVFPFLVPGAVAIVFGRALQGAGDVTPPMLITIFSLWCLQVPLAAHWSRAWNPPTEGIWWAVSIASLVHGLLITGWFQVGRWKKKTV